MPGSAENLIRRYWEIQDEGDYVKLCELFTDDAVFVDPGYGTFTGREAIEGFMAIMNEELPKTGATFVVDEIVGDEQVAWARWKGTTANGEITGASIYRIRDGLIAFEQDYLNQPRSD